jgi:hypothetical protein
MTPTFYNHLDKLGVFRGNSGAFCRQECLFALLVCTVNVECLGYADICAKHAKEQRGDAVKCARRDLVCLSVRLLRGLVLVAVVMVPPRVLVHTLDVIFVIYTATVVYGCLNAILSIITVLITLFGVMMYTTIYNVGSASPITITTMHTAAVPRRHRRTGATCVAQLCQRSDAALQLGRGFVGESERQEFRERTRRCARQVQHPVCEHACFAWNVCVSVVMFAFWRVYACG